MSNPENSFLRRRAAWRAQLLADIKQIGLAAFALAHIIDKYLSAETFSAFPGQVLMAETAGISLRTVRDAMKTLVERGHLKVAQSAGGVATLTPILFSKNEPPPSEKPKPKSKPGNGHDTGKEAPPWPADYQEIFSRHYPRREGYGPAKKALAKIARSHNRPDWQTFTAGLAYYKKYAEDGIDDRKYLLVCGAMVERATMERPAGISEAETRSERRYAMSGCGKFCRGVRQQVRQ